MSDAMIDYLIGLIAIDMKRSKSGILMSDNTDVYQERYELAEKVRQHLVRLKTSRK